MRSTNLMIFVRSPSFVVVYNCHCMTTVMSCSNLKVTLTTFSPRPTQIDLSTGNPFDLLHPLIPNNPIPLIQPQLNRRIMRSSKMETLSGLQSSWSHVLWRQGDIFKQWSLYQLVKHGSSGGSRLFPHPSKQIQPFRWAHTSVVPPSSPSRLMGSVPWSKRGI